MESKVEEIKVTNCFDCPFLHYNPHYDMSNDSGYDCHHPNGNGHRCISDYQMDKPSKHDYFLPGWCPLAKKQLKITLV